MLDRRRPGPPRRDHQDPLPLAEVTHYAGRVALVRDGQPPRVLWDLELLQLRLQESCLVGPDLLQLRLQLFHASFELFTWASWASFTRAGSPLLSAQSPYDAAPAFRWPRTPLQQSPSSMSTQDRVPSRNLNVNMFAKLLPPGG
uniref:Uncharacterized protein n=1 Tax=Phaeomonas parva TaxID=124430 RepID=A0A7S1TZJ0_9STRA